MRVSSKGNYLTRDKQNFRASNHEVNQQTSLERSILLERISNLQRALARRRSQSTIRNLKATRDFVIKMIEIALLPDKEERRGIQWARRLR